MTVGVTSSSAENKFATVQLAEPPAYAKTANLDAVRAGALVRAARRWRFRVEGVIPWQSVCMQQITSADLLATEQLQR